MKNITKKLLSISLALIMALFCFAPAFAASVCEDCQAAFDGADAYTRHQKICGELNGVDKIIFCCSYCGKDFATKATFQKHLDSEHKLEFEKSTNENTCPYCNGKFSKENAYNNHIQLCCNPTYECEVCGVSFTNKDAAYWHEKLCAVAKEVTIVVSIQNKPDGAKTVNYGDKVRIEAVADKELPSNCFIDFSVAGSGAAIVRGIAEGKYYCYVEATGSGSATVTAKLYIKNSDGTVSVVKDLNGDEISDSQQFTMKAGFFQKIISFFKDLFGANRVTVQ
ncbi:MAG: C2H2-type zinc finger protein [Acutalibacteraceae bacterium]